MSSSFSEQEEQQARQMANRLLQIDEKSYDNRKKRAALERARESIEAFNREAESWWWDAADALPQDPESRMRFERLRGESIDDRHEGERALETFEEEVRQEARALEHERKDIEQQRRALAQKREDGHVNRD